MLKLRSDKTDYVSYPQLWLLLPLCVGIWVGRLSYDLLSAYTVYLFAGSALLVAILLMLQRLRASSARMVSVCILVLSMLGLGMSLVHIAIGRVQTDWPNEAQPYAIRVVSLPKSSDRSIGVEAEIVRGAYAGKRIRLFQPDSVRPELGKTYWVYCRIEQPKPSGNPYAFDFGEYLLTQSVSGTAYSRLSASFNEQESSFSLRIWSLRLQSQAVERLKTYFGGTDFALLAAMTVGDKRGLDPEVREVFSETGTSHLLALSGLHLGLLFGVFQFFVLNRIRRRSIRFVAVGIGIVLVWLYTLVAGMPLSMQRAALMLSMAQLMQLARHDTLGIDRLLVSALLLLVVSPLSLFDVGFQLSFLSVASILTLTPLFPSVKLFNNGFLRAVYNVLLVSLSAWIGTMPVVAYYFHVVGVYSLPANLIAVVLAYPLIVVSGIFLVVPNFSSLLVPIIQVLLRVLSDVLQFLSDLPGSTLRLYPTAVGTMLALLGVFVCSFWIRRQSKRYGMVLVLLLSALIVVETWAHRPGRLPAQIVFYNLWRGSAVQAIRSDGTAYLWTHGEDANRQVRIAARDFWERENIKPSQPLDSAFRDKNLQFAPPLLSFGGIRVALLCDKQLHRYSQGSFAQFTDSRVVQAPLQSDVLTIPVDYILVCKGYSGKPTQSLARYPKGTIVLDASLGAGYRNMWHVVADSLHRAVHDMQRDGALIVRIKSD